MGVNTERLRRMWDKFLDNLLGEIDRDRHAEIERAVGFSQLREQLWAALENSEQSAAGWAYPVDIFLGDNGSDLFSIVAQNGKFYEMPIKVENANLTIGEWTEVKQEFVPVAQSKFVIRKQADGRHRWSGIVATSVLNRVAEIDSTDLFDSFIEHWQDTGEAPRVDYYHMGETDPEAWEFGTADYLARDGCCYIASGLFDEDHPLAKATIRAYERDPEGTWGWSIEFYAHAEPEVVVVEPKIQIPVYKRGKNTRISVVKEEDAAGLFTRIGIIEEKSRMASRDVEAKLKELFGDDEEGALAFLSNVDTVNRTIKDKKLVHRDKKDDPKETPAPAPPHDDDDDGEEDDEDTPEKEETELVLDEEVVDQIAEKVAKSPTFQAIQKSLETLQASVTQFASAREEDAKEISRLKKINAKVTERLEQVEKTDDEKQQTWTQDLPRKRQVQVTTRPKDTRRGRDEDEEEEDFEDIANRTLESIPNSY